MFPLQTAYTSHLRKLIHTALFAALCCVTTVLVVIPLPYGYLNAGDATVLLAAFCLGPWYGALAAGIGCALADLFCGFALYAPATLLIKAITAAAAALLLCALKRPLPSPRLDFPLRALCCLLGEAIMAGGYFAYELLLYGVSGALLTLPANLMQGLVCAVCGVLLTSLLRAVAPARRAFPRLSR